MTLILAVSCADGVILASDSQATYSTSGQAVRKAVNKLRRLSASMAWAASGNVGIAQRVEAALGTSHPGHYEKAQTPMELRKRLYDTVIPVLKQMYGDFRAFGQSSQPPLTSFLFCGYCAGKPFLYEITHDLTDVEHTDVGFAAIGSGDIYPYHADTMLGHYKVSGRPVSEGQLVSYRIVDAAIATAAQLLAGPVQMVVIQEPGSGEAKPKFHQLTDVEIRILGDKVLEWKKVEAEALDEYVGLTPSLEPP